MALNSALVDKARIVYKDAAAPRVAGRTRLQETTGPYFKVRLFLPSPSESQDSQGARRRQVKQPTVLISNRDELRDPVLVEAKHRLQIVSRELGTATWEVVGDPEPLRKRRKVIGYQATVKRLVEPTRDDE